MMEKFMLEFMMMVHTYKNGIKSSARHKKQTQIRHNNVHNGLQVR